MGQDSLEPGPCAPDDPARPPRSPRLLRPRPCRASPGGRDGFFPNIPPQPPPHPRPGRPDCGPKSPQKPPNEPHPIGHRPTPTITIRESWACTNKPGPRPGRPSSEASQRYEPPPLAIHGRSIDGAHRWDCWVPKSTPRDPHHARHGDPPRYNTNWLIPLQTSEHWVPQNSNPAPGPKASANENPRPPRPKTLRGLEHCAGIRLGSLPNHGSGQSWIRSIIALANHTSPNQYNMSTLENRILKGDNNNKGIKMHRQ